MYDAYLTLVRQATELLIITFDELSVLIVHLAALLRGISELWPEI